MRWPAATSTGCSAGRRPRCAGAACCTTPAALDPEAMNAAAALLVGTHDLRAFTPARTEHVFFDRTVDELRVDGSAATSWCW